MKKEIEALTRAYQEVTEKTAMVCKDCGDEFGKPKSDCENDCSDPKGNYWVKKDSVDEASCGTMRKSKKEAMDPVDQGELKGSHADRKDKDINNDGKVTGTDKYLHKRRKAVSKAVKKGEDTATMNPKMDSGSGKTEQKEAAENQSADKKPEEYVGRDGKKHVRMVPVDKEVIKKESTDMSIREKLVAVLEKKGHGNTDQKQAYDDNWSPGAKKMRDDNKDTGEYLDLEKQSHDDASKAGRVTKSSAPNPTDKDAKGDKNVVNPVKDTTKAGKGDPSVKESFSKTVHSIAAAYQSMYESEVTEDTATQIAKHIRKMGVKHDAKEADILKHVPTAMKKLGLDKQKHLKTNPDIQGDIVDAHRGMK